MDGVVRARPGVARLAPLLLALAIPVVVLAGAGVKAVVARVFAPRPVYASPPSATSPVMAWDGARNQVVMVTGVGGDLADGAYPVTTTWTWDGSGWVAHTRGDQPPVGPGSTALAAYDPALREIVLVVSRSPGVAATWAWNGQRWRGLSGGTTLPVTEPAMAYDEVHGQLLLAGLSAAGGARIDTYALAGSDWNLLPGAMEPGLGPVQLAFDHSANRLLLVPGAEQPTPQPPPQPCPTPRTLSNGALMAPSCGGDIGGFYVPPCQSCQVTPLAWTGTSWASTHMTARAGTVVPDPAGDGLLDVVASTDSWRGVWRWDGGRWSRIAGLPLGTSVYGWAVAPDPDAGQLVLYGGSVSNGGFQPQSRTLDATWTLDGGGWTRRAGHALPKLPAPAAPPTPEPCSATTPSLSTSTEPDGSLSISVRLPLTGPAGACDIVPGTLRLETRDGRLLRVQGNPADLTPPGQFAVESPDATWSNWCGSRPPAVIRLSGEGFDLRKLVTAWPSCSSARTGSRLFVARIAMEQ